MSDVTSLVPKCMFLKEFTLARTHTYLARTRRGRFGVVQSPREPCGRATPCTWGVKSQSHSLSLLSGPSCR